MSNPKIIVFASGSKDGGGSGFEKLVEAVKSGVLDAEIVAVVSNHEHGGVRERADRLGIPFIHFVPPKNGTFSVAAAYQRVVRDTGAEWIALSGWLKLVKGLDPSKTFNIHPALLSLLNGRFGGVGMYGHHVHEAIKESLDAGEITESGVTMHFVTDEYDRGPVFFEKRIQLSPGMTADAIGKLVNNVEHAWQAKITNMVVNGQISWDGENPGTLKVPDGYEFLPPALE
jgi:phosphoribosylglycinamide formyltransferase 1